MNCKLLSMNQSTIYINYVIILKEASGSFNEFAAS